MWHQTTTISHVSGAQEAFSIGIDGFIWSYLVGSPSGQGGRLKSTGLRATSFALGHTGDGRTVVIATDGRLVHYVLETEDAQQRWSAACEMHFPGEKDVLSVDQIFVQCLNGNLFLGLSTRHLHENGSDVFRFWDAIWAGGGFVFCNKPVTLERGLTIWREQVASRPMPI